MASISSDEITSDASAVTLTPGIGLLRALPRCRAHLRDCEHLGILQTRKVPYDIWPPITVANHTEVHEGFTVLFNRLETHW